MLIKSLKNNINYNIIINNIKNKNLNDQFDYLIKLKKFLYKNNKLFNKNNLILKCNNNIWIYCVKNNNNIYIYGSSDSLIINGILALILSFFNNKNSNNILNRKINKIFLKNIFYISLFNKDEILNQINILNIIKNCIYIKIKKNII